MGLAIAKRLSQMDMDVIIFDIQAPPEGFQYYQVDIRKDDQILTALSQIPRVDILINNAGIYFEKYLEDTSNEELDQMVDVNIKGTYRMTGNALPNHGGKRKYCHNCILPWPGAGTDFPFILCHESWADYAEEMSCTAVCGCR